MGSAARSAPADPYARCAALAARHYENFPVRAPFLPRDARRDLAAVYAWCRTTDDLGDDAPGDRAAGLAAWEEGTRAALGGSPPPDDPLLAALAETIQRRRIPAELFHRLIEANRRDQTVVRYADADALLEYCRHSATPVGRMVLGIIDAPEAPVECADATSIGLQLANFWQDLKRDWLAGRCYLPLDACARHGVVPEVELARPAASGALASLVEEMVGWARAWLRRGWPLADHLPVRWRPLVRGFTRGGWAICDAIARGGYDTLAARPTVSRGERRRILATELLRAPRRNLPLP